MCVCMISRKHVYIFVCMCVLCMYDVLRMYSLSRMLILISANAEDTSRIGISKLKTVIRLAARSKGEAQRLQSA